MTRSTRRLLLALSTTLVWSPLIGAAAPQTTTSMAQSTALGSATIPRAVIADGKPLPAARYQLRVTADEPAAVVGESPQSERWVEFLRNGRVAGRELASVVSSADIGSVADGKPPAMGTTRVEMLKSGEYLRVWAAQNGKHYLINLAVGPSQPEAGLWR